MYYSTNMNSNRHSSPPPFLPTTEDTLRPPTQRKRSNSVPIMEALGCSTPEAQLILAEGRAAVSTRKEFAHRRGRRVRNERDPSRYNPKDHLQYLYANASDAPNKEREDSMNAQDRRVHHHSRNPSDVSDSSVNTVTASHDPFRESNTSSNAAATTPVGNYSANLAQFIRAQLSSIPTYSADHSPLSPKSCPDLSPLHGATPQSPTKLMHRAIEPPRMINIPPVRPPMQSAFSAWSSTDDDTDDDHSALPTSDPDMGVPVTDAYHTPSLSRFYGTSNESSFLFPETPLDEELNTVQDYSFPTRSSPLSARSPAPVRSSSPPPPMPSLPNAPTMAPSGPPSSTTSSRSPSLATSSVPSISTVSTGSYFDFALNNPNMRDRVIAAVTPPAVASHTKMLDGRNSFDGKRMANVHDALVDSQHRINIDGMSFDIIGEYPGIVGDAGARGVNSMHRVQTPC